MKKTRMCFSMLVFSLLLLLMMQPVLAEDIYDQEISVSYYRIPWGNGVDDNGDGVIDDFDELDVAYGNGTFNLTDNVIDGWYNNWTFWNSTTTNNPIPGVKIAAHYEELWEIESSFNASVSPTKTCYQSNNITTQYTTVSNVVNVATFYVDLSPGDIMTGCQEFWYRSPICWDNTTFNEEMYGTFWNVPEYYLNIYDEDNVLVYATNDVPLEKGNPWPKMVPDNSTVGTDYLRLYAKISMPFKSETRYRFEEYIGTIDDNPINSIKLYMAPAQDVGADEITDTYIFSGTSDARKIPVECSWGMLCTIGLGLAGTERIIYSGEPHSGIDNGVSIIPQIIGGDVNDVDAITVVMPLRTTKVLNISVGVLVTSGGSTWNSVAVDGLYQFGNITGTLIVTFNITDPDAGATNDYEFIINIENFDEGVGDAMTYVMYPSSGAFHYLRYNGMEYHSLETIHFGCFVEVREYEAAAEEQENSSPDSFEFLLGLDLIIGGLLIVSAVILAPVSIPLMAAGVLFGTLNMVIGGAMVIHSFTGEGIENFPSWFASQLPRAARGIWEGILNVAGTIQDVIIRVVETVKNIGSALLHWGGIIVEAIVDIIYFVTAVIVWWLTAKFLSIMGAVRDGDVERAARTILSVEGSIRGQAAKRYRDVARPIKKARRLVRRKR